MIEFAAITGAAKGVGNSYAAKLAAKGARLLLIDQDRDGLKETAQNLSQIYAVDIETIVADLSKPEDQTRVAKRLEEIEELDLLINLAGYGAPVPFHELDAEQHIHMLNVHVSSVIRFCRAVLPNMVKRKRGAIINMSGQAEFLHSGANAMYGSTKKFVTTFSRNLADSYKLQGINFQVLCPGYIRTSFHDTNYYNADALGKIPKFYWMDVDEVTSKSLEQLGNGRLICVPGLWHKITYLLFQTGGFTNWILRKFAV